MFNQLIAVFTTPVAAFQAVREKPTVLFPLLLVMVVSALAQVIIINLIDFNYLIDALVAQAASQNDVPESELRQGMSIMTPTLMTVSGVASVVVGLPLINAIYAGYLMLIGKLGSDELNYKHFFSMVCWAGVVRLVSTIAATLMVLLSGDKQFAQSDLNPLTLQNLLFRGSDLTSPVLSNLDITSIWGLVLLVIGFKVLTSSSWLKSSLVVLIPPALIIGGIAALTS